MTKDNVPPPSKLVPLAVIFEGGLGLLAVGVGWLIGCPTLATIHRSPADLVWGFAAAVPLAGLLWLCVHVPVGPLRSLLGTIDEQLVPLFRDCTLLELAVISLLAGFGEELLFRAVMQEGVAGWVGGMYGVWVGLVVASVVFGLAHLITPMYGLLAGAMGFYLGWLWIDTRNLLVPITAHAVYDFFALVYLAKMRTEEIAPAAAGELDRRDRRTNRQMGERVGTILDKIVATKQQEIERAKAAVPEAVLRGQLEAAPPVRDFFAALANPGSIRLIAEVKKASPSKGIIRADFRPVEIAQTYEKHGASCISVLTDEQYFQGSLDYLRQIRAAVGLPVLRKDFVIDTYQVLEARAAGADAVLLIAECLDDDLLKQLHDAVVELGMTPLVELYDPANLPRVLAIGARCIGVNNRDLRTFEVDLEHTLGMRREIPADRLLVGESGIRSRDDVRRLEAAGVNAMLVGETLMASEDIGAAVDELLGRK